MSTPAPPAPSFPISGSAVLLAALLAFLGLLGGLPLFLGPVLAVVGVAVASLLRGRRRPAGPSWVEPVPVLLVLATLAFSAPVAASTELAAGAGSLALLLWLADDPARRVGVGRRAVPIVALAALAFALGWALTLAVPATAAEIGLAGGLLAVALVVVTFVLLRASDALRAETA